ncbi:MAG: hypothetical protein K6A23_09650 [Butyrivibrio sp.]|nr:hypothetical protein [Butyrivibrio sp.]
MQYCPKCKISIRGHKECCPLCQSNLVKNPNEELAEIDDYGAFPIVKKPKFTSVFITKLITFIFVTVEILGYTTMTLLGDYVPWVSLFMLGAFFAWIDFLVAMYYKHNVIKLLTVQVMVAIIIDLYVDYCFGFTGWSYKWMIPISLMVLAIVTFIIAKVSRLKLIEYIRYLLFDMFVALLQLIFIFTGMNDFPVPAGFCIAGFLIIFAAALIFRTHDLKSASARYFNM